MIALWRGFLRIASEILDGCFGHDAYRRFLQTQGKSHSAEQWRRFQDEYGKLRHVEDDAASPILGGGDLRAGTA